MNARPLFLVVDGHSLFYRCVYSPGQPLTSPVTGEPTKGPYLTLLALEQMLEDLRPTDVAVALDSPRGTTFRKKLFPDYKANRPEVRDDGVDLQVRRCRELVRLLGLPCFEVDGFEADDVVATLVAQSPCDAQVVVASRDKDLHQLVRDSRHGEGAIVVRDFSAGGKTYDQVAVREEWGVRADQVVDYMTLVGDPSDNLPGVRGIGPEKAKRLLAEYGTVARVRGAALSRAISAGGPRDAALRAVVAADLDLLRRLVELRDDVPLPNGYSTRWSGALDFESARELLGELGIRRWTTPDSGTRSPAGRGRATFSFGRG